MTRSTIRRSNPSSEERRRPRGRSAAAGLVLVLAATLLPVTAVRAADPEVPPAVDPGTPKYVGLEDPVPDGAGRIRPDPQHAPGLLRRRPGRRRRLVLDRPRARAARRGRRRRRRASPVHQGQRPLHVHPQRDHPRVRRPGHGRQPGRRRFRLPRADRRQHHEPVHGHRVRRRADGAGCGSAPVSEPLVERPHRRRPARRPAQVHHREQRRGHDPHADEHGQRADNPHDHRRHAERGHPVVRRQRARSAASTPATT